MNLFVAGFANFEMILDLFLPETDDFVFIQMSHLKAVSSYTAGGQMIVVFFSACYVFILNLSTLQLSALH